MPKSIHQKILPQKTSSENPKKKKKNQKQPAAIFSSDRRSTCGIRIPRGSEDRKKIPCGCSSYRVCEGGMGEQARSEETMTI